MDGRPIRLSTYPFVTQHQLMSLFAEKLLLSYEQSVKVKISQKLKYA